MWERCEQQRGAPQACTAWCCQQEPPSTADLMPCQPFRRPRILTRSFAKPALIIVVPPSPPPAGYGASLSPTDRAVWSLAQAINLRLWQRAGAPGGVQAMEVDSGSESDSESGSRGGEEGDGAGKEAVAALLAGPLAETG